MAPAAVWRAMGGLECPITGHLAKSAPAVDFGCPGWATGVVGDARFNPMRSAISILIFISFLSEPD